MIRQPMMDEKIVAKTESSAGIPASARMMGLTTMMYEMAKKAVMPAKISFCHKRRSLRTPSNKACMLFPPESS